MSRDCRRSLSPSAAYPIPNLLLVTTSLALAWGAWGARAAPVESPAPGTAPDSATEARGFVEPVELIPQIGLWVDGVAELGYAKKTGLVLWWSLEKPDSAAAAARVGAPRVDWSRVTFRIRAEVFDAKGKRVAREEELVDPLKLEVGNESDGFPAPLRIALRAGTYRVRLEAYPLISARATGLDSVPRGVAEATAKVPDLSLRTAGWSISDPLFLDGIRRWEPGAPEERTWYEWVVRPNPSRRLSGRGSTGQLAFEVVRAHESVPRCGANTCRVVVTVNDAQGGIVLQELRPVPEAATAGAYLIPIDASELPPGRYSVTIEVFEAALREAAIRREFSVASSL